MAISAVVGISAGVADAQTVRLTDSGTETFRTARSQPDVIGDSVLGGNALGGAPGDVVGGVAPPPGTVLPGGPIMPEADFSIPGGVAGADCGFGCPERWYGVAEAAYFTREDRDDGFTLSNGLSEVDFDYEPGVRFTIGHTNDCLDGWEATFTGIFEWEDEDLTIATDSLDALFLPGNLLVFNDLSTFYFADAMAHRYESEMYSAEAYQRWWGWDVFSVKLGGKYINLEEQYDLFTASNGADGFFSMAADNHIGMLKGGIDMMSPMGRWTIGGKFGGGLGINFNDGNMVLINDGTTIVDAGDTSEELAWELDAGAYVIYRWTDRIALHAGYEAWYLWGLNTPAEQDFTFIHFDSGTGYDEKGDILFHGGTAGIEFVW